MLRRKMKWLSQHNIIMPQNDLESYNEIFPHPQNQWLTDEQFTYKE